MLGLPVLASRAHIDLVFRWHDLLIWNFTGALVSKAMTYQPLATKYRPQSFSEVVGQEVASTTLQNAIKAGRISHAYLFSGMRGVGKTTTARLLAKCLNCRSVEEPTVEPCGTCESCREIAASRSIDVLEIDAASNTSVDDVRALQENLIYAPARDRYKVYIVDEVHMLSKSAFNAFLKTLEEPPPHVVFIFATTEVNRIPQTVLSRCMIFEFGRVAAPAISERLKAICSAEKVEAEEAAIDLIVFQSEGSIRDAISALDQVINFAGNTIKYEHALRALGLADREVLHGLMNAIIEQNAEKSFELLRQVADTGADMRLFCRHLIRHIRDLMVIKVGGKSRELLPYSDQEMDILLEQSQRVSEEDLSRFFDILVRADGEMQFAATPRYHLEAGVVKMIHSTRLKPLTELIAALKSADIAQTSIAPEIPPKEQTLDFGSNAASQRSSPPATGNPKDLLLAEAKGTDVFTFLKMANDVALEESTLIITLSSAGQVTVLSQGQRRTELQQAVHRAFGADIRIELKNGGLHEVVTEEENGAQEEQPAGDDEIPLPDDSEIPEEPPGDSATEDFIEESAGAPDSKQAELEKKLRKDPLAGKLFQELDLKIDRVRDVETEEEKE